MLFLNTKNEPNNLGVSNQSTSNKPAKRGSVYGKASISLDDAGEVKKVTPSKRHVVQPNSAVKFGESVVVEEKPVHHKIMADPIIAEHAKNSHIQLGGATAEHFKPSINCENSKNADTKKDHIDFVTPVAPQVARKVIMSETQKIFLETDQNSVTKSVESRKKRGTSSIPKKTDKLKSVIEMDKSTMVDDIRKKKVVIAKSSIDSVAFGDEYTPPVVEQEKKKNKGEFLSPAPVTVNHKSQTYKSAVFNSAQYENKENTKTAKSFVCSPSKSNKTKNVIFNHETSNSEEVRSAKKKCGNPLLNGSVTTIGKQCLNYPQMESNATPNRSAKKMAVQNNTSIFKFDSCMSPKKETEAVKAKKHFAPVVDHINQPAAGMKPKQEAMPRVRGPIGGRTSLILG